MPGKKILVPLIFAIPIVIGNKSSGGAVSPDGKIDLASLYSEFYTVSNAQTVIDLFGEKLEHGDPGSITLADYFNATEFVAINEHMWKSVDYRKVTPLST